MYIENRYVADNFMGQIALEPTRLQRQFCIELVKNGGHNATAAYKAAVALSWVPGNQPIN